MKKRLDRLFSQIVRGAGKCVKCGNVDYSKLQCAHIFSRSQLTVRWDFDNVLCLCAGCHFWAHKNPLLFSEFVRNYLGECKYEMLKMRAAALSTAVTIDDLLALEIELKKQIVADLSALQKGGDDSEQFDGGSGNVGA